jgi:hypothetical protein
MNRAALIKTLQFFCFCVLISRAYQHLFWDIPLRAFFWDEALLKPIVEYLTQDSWQAYATSKWADELINGIKFSMGIFYLIAAIIVLFIQKTPQIIGRILPLSTVLLFVLAALYCKEKFYSIGQLLEYAVQFMLPLMLYFLVYKVVEGKTVKKIALVAVALTFICHGLYAVGYYPIPASFYNMTMNILGVGEEGARLFLKIAGYLDFITAFLIFMPSNKVRNLALIYMTFWGIATAIARIWANFYWDFYVESLHQYGFETVLRLVHGGLPFCLFYFAWDDVDDRDRQG